jgi:hypothetical protein
VPISSGGAWPRSLPYCPADAANRRSVWITGPSGGWVPGALCARQCGPCPAFSPVSSWVPAAPRTGRSRQCDGRRVKPYRQSGSWPCRCLGTSRWSGRQIQVCSSSLKAAGILGRTTGSPTSPSRQHNYVRGLQFSWRNIIWIGSPPDRKAWIEIYGTQNRKDSIAWSGRRESNPHDQLGRLELYH